MQKTKLTIKFFYSVMFAGLLACSSAPTAVKRANTVAPTGQAANTADDATKTDQKTADNKTTTEVESPAPTPTPTPTAPAAPAAPAPLTLTSTAFTNMTAIPAAHSARGTNLSPPLEWKSVPAGTGFFAIQMLDLDNQVPPLIHWMITNIPATSTKLPAAVAAGNNLAAPTEAIGANQTKSYGGPNPPAGTVHRYEWTVYAIKAGETLTIGNNSATNKTELEAKSLGKATLTGTFLQ